MHERPSSGGLTGQIRRHLARSGTGILPYLAVNFGLPDLLRRMADARAAWLRRTKWSAGPLMTVLANEAVPHEPDIAEALKREGEAINRAFTDLFAARGFPPEQAARNGRLARSMLDGATTLCRAVRSDEALRETGDFLATHLAAPEHDGA